MEAVQLIEVITYTDCILRIPSEDNYTQQVKSLLLQLKGVIETKEIDSISTPIKNYNNSSLEIEIHAFFILNIQESSTDKKVDEYVHEVVPFLQRHLPDCNKVKNTKIIQMKRTLENNDIQEQSIKFY